MREMVGGCCVCSDDRGWSENPLVYCDGQSCTVAVHQGNSVFCTYLPVYMTHEYVKLVTFTSIYYIYNTLHFNS